MKQYNNMRVALVHDFMIQQGGAERVLKELCQMYPDAPIYTLLHDQEKMRGMFDGKDIRPSYLQKFPKFLRQRHRWLLPFYASAIETFDLRDFDLIISSSGAWSKGIVTKLNTKHVAYIHSPMRYVWDYNERYLSELKKKPSLFLRFMLNYLRVWDRLAAERPDHLIANSKYTQQRIEKYYRRESEVIYPPVSMPPVISQQSSDGRLPANGYFLVVSRLSPYKKVDVVVQAFNKLELPLVIIGEGKQAKHLKKIAKNNITFLDWQDDGAIQRYYANAKAFVFPSEDDFGLTPVEAMLGGIPVIAYRAGGATETVQEGITGEFFDAQTPEVLADGIRRFMLNEKKYDSEAIKKQAEIFSVDRFKEEFTKYINNIMQK